MTSEANQQTRFKNLTNLRDAIDTSIGSDIRAEVDYFGDLFDLLVDLDAIDADECDYHDDHDTVDVWATSGEWRLLVTLR